MIQKRETCVLCTHSTLDLFYTFKNFPILYNPTNSDIKDDIFTDFEFVICSQCRCIQFASLLDPDILYSCDNTILHNAFWERHHSSFIRFVETHAESKRICEIGGGSNPLFNYFFKKGMDYTIVDIYTPKEKIEGVNYVLGNCETFTNYTSECLLMSHTFEHLYNPRNFLHSIQNSSINYVCISVPDFETYLKKKKTILFLNNQHTFYYDIPSLIWLFRQYGFDIVHVEGFEEHSLFFSFKRSSVQLDMASPLLPFSIEKEMYAHFHEKVVQIQAMIITKPYYIMPATIYGQFVYLFLNNKENCLGFIDNDVNKLGKRIYGTPHRCSLPSVFLEKKANDIVLIKTLYYEQMILQLQNQYPQIKVHVIDIL